MQTSDTPPAPATAPAPTAAAVAQAVFFLDHRVLLQLLADAEGRGKRQGYIEGLEDSARAHRASVGA
jgi:hypothetical protein